MKMAFMTLLALLGVGNCLVYGANPFIDKKPEFAKTCSISAPNPDECHKEQLKIMFDKLVEGIPEIGIMPTDPLKVTEINILSGEGPVNIEISLKDVTIYGFKEMKIIDASTDFKTMKTSSRIAIPKFRVEGKYKSDGRVLVVPLKGQGDCWIECYDLDVHTGSTFKIIKRDGHSYFNVTGQSVDYKLKNLKLQLNNLFGGNKELSQGTNDYLNGNWKELNDAFKPLIKDTIESLLHSTLGKIFGSIPAEYFWDHLGSN